MCPRSGSEEEETREEIEQLKWMILAQMKAIPDMEQLIATTHLTLIQLFINIGMMERANTGLARITSASCPRLLDQVHQRKKPAKSSGLHRPIAGDILREIIIIIDSPQRTAEVFLRSSFFGTPGDRQLHCRVERSDNLRTRAAQRRGTVQPPRDEEIPEVPLIICFFSRRDGVLN